MYLCWDVFVKGHIALSIALVFLLQKVTRIIVCKTPNLCHEDMRYVFKNFSEHFSAFHMRISTSISAAQYHIRIIDVLYGDQVMFKQF